MDAPTSFITSISLRREKIESRIVLAIRIIAAASRIATANRNTDSITCASCSTRLVVFWPYFTSSTPGGGGLRLAAIFAVSSPRLGITSSEFGSGLVVSAWTISGCSLRIFARASSLETNLTPPGLTSGLSSSWSRTCAIWDCVASLPHSRSVQK